MKHVQKDKTFIYYYERRKDCSYVGFRVGHSGAWLIESEITDVPNFNPEKMSISGKLHVIPLDETKASPEFLANKEQLAQQELDDLLSGKIDFDAASK